MALASGDSDGNDKKLPKPSVQIATRCINSVAQGVIGGILIGVFLPAASAKDKRPTPSEDEALQARVAKIKQSMAQSSSSGQTSDPVQWYNWNNWPNWGNWNNWPNWGNWLNW
jgi:hypothetical protein